MQLRVVTDQPWDVKADVLAIPIVGEPAFDGPLGELNRRTGGELAALAAFGELRAKRFTSSVAAPGEVAAGRVLTISAGDAAKLDRETVLHIGAAAEHRLGGRHARTLATAQAMLVEAKTLRDALASTVDVTTLTQWIDRNDEYDTALARLYRATIAAKGRITQELKDAFVAERKAHDFLPSNTSGIVIILAEIGRGGLNQAVIGIEETRAKLQAAVDRLSTPASGEPGPSDNGAGPSPSGG